MASLVWPRMPSIALLLKVGSPSAIGRLVVAAVVDAVDRMLRGWPASHIGKERLIGVTPAFADSNSTAAVISKLLVMWRRAPLAQALPRYVFRSGAVSVSPAVDAAEFSSDATATARASSGQQVTKCDVLVSAVAATQPANTLAGGIIAPNYNQTTYALSNLKLNWQGHNASILSGMVG